MIAPNVIDGVVDLVEQTVPAEEIAGTIYEDKEALKQYVAFHYSLGNTIITVDPKTGKVSGAMICYECDEEYAKNPFIWDPPYGKKCIFVAQLAAKDEDARDLLAEGFLQYFPDEKPSYAIRRGKFVPMNVHKIARGLLSRRTNNGGR